MTPAVSVVMPVWNGERFLREAIESVLEQTLSDLELIVVDDGSTDGTPDILDEYTQADERVVVTRTAHVGQAAARNAAVALARADLVALLDADDVSCPDRLERQRAFLAAHETVALVGGAVTFIDAQGRVFADNVRYPVTDVEIRAAFSHTTPLLNSASTGRTAAFRQAGGYRSLFADSEDLDLLLRVAERNELANLEESVVRYRMHGVQASTLRLEQQSMTALAARLSARARAEGRADPFDGLERLDRPTLRELGATDEAIAETFVVQGTWVAKTLYRAGNRAASEKLLTEVLERARASGLRQLVEHVEAARSQLFGRTWRARLRSLLPG